MKSYVIAEYQKIQSMLNESLRDLRSQNRNEFDEDDVLKNLQNLRFWLHKLESEICPIAGAKEFFGNPRFGLARDKSLTAQGIIRACFSNPDRMKFPDFGHQYRGWYDYCNFVNDPEHLIKKIRKVIPTYLKSFNQKQIHLWDIEVINPRHYSTSDFLETIQRCRWFGPYKRDGKDRYYFCTIDSKG